VRAARYFSITGGELMARKQYTVPANKDVLKWARLQRGLSVNEAAERLKISNADLLQIEAGVAPPTEIFDRMIAVYKQPESTLLLAKPPAVSPMPEDYRTQEGRRTPLSSETKLAIREAQELQTYVSELLDDDPDLSKKIELRPTALSDDPEKRAAKERERIGVSLETQLQWQPGDASFNKWRMTLEELGVLVLLKKMPWEDCRGFSLVNSHLLPTIVVNSEDTPAARIFTLFHEYAHLTLRNAGICKLTPNSSQTERWCNLFASSFLLPPHELTSYVSSINPQAGSQHDWPLAQIYRLALHFRVSRSVMALRLQRLGLAVPDYYEKHKGELNSFDQKAKPTTPPRIVRPPGWKQKRKLREVGRTAASIILNAWKEDLANPTEAADILNLSLDELHGFREQTEAQHVRKAS
jgi:Zn-dependent peptidase ImmA (M78 family)